jgi:hypothetical protein
LENNEKISQGEMIDALQRSGYLLESRLLRTLSNHDYTLFPNEVYPDPITKKSREIDIYGLNSITGKIKLDRELKINIRTNLVIECSNNPQPAIFFKRTDKKKFTIYERFKYVKLEQNPFDADTSPDYEFHCHTTESKHFHYNSYNRCTQYCSFQKKGNGKKEWFATHPDGLHDVFNKLYDFVNHKARSDSEWLESGYHQKEVHVILYFPVIVLQNELFEAIEEKKKLSLSEVDHTIYEFSRFENDSKSFLIDVVSEKKFDEYLELVNQDMKELLKMYLEYYRGKVLDDSELPF